MKIACISAPERGAIDRLLSGAARALQAEGVVLAGIVKEQSHDATYENGCDMKVRVLPAGPVIKITQNLGAGSDSCRLDPGAIAEAVSCVEAGALYGADLFLLNKFGPEEAQGRGFCAVIGRALEHGVPVLVGVGAANITAFEEFADGLAEQLPATPKAILEWCRAARAARVA